VPVPEKPTVPVPEKPPVPAPEKPTVPVPEKPPVPAPEKPTVPVPEKPTVPVPEKPPVPAPEKPTVPVPEKPPVPVPEKAKTQEELDGSVLEAVAAGNVDALKSALDAGADINTKAAGGVSALLLAANTDYRDVTALLVERGADPKAEADNGYTPLLATALGGDNELLELMMEHGVGVNDANSLGLTVLQAAATAGQLETARFLIERGAEVNTQASDGSTAMHRAAEKGYVEVAQLLLDNGAAVNLQSNDGDTALHVAAEHGQAEMAQLLLENGAQYDVTNRDRKTPADVAEQHGNAEVLEAIVTSDAAKAGRAQAALNAELLRAVQSPDAIQKVQSLLDNNVDITTRDDAGNTALHLAVQVGDAKMTTLLLGGLRERGPAVYAGYINAPNSAGHTPLHLAVIHGQMEALEVLLRPGLGVNRQSEDARGETAVHWAAKTGQAESLERLLAGTGLTERYSAVNRPNEDGYTPLHLAVLGEHIGVARLLLEKGARVNVADNMGRRPLHLAAASCSVKMARYLLDQGADKDPADEAGKTPLDVAAEKGCEEIVALLGGKVVAPKTEEQARITQSDGRITATINGMLGPCGIEYYDKQGTARPVTFIVTHPDQGGGFGNLRYDPGEPLAVSAGFGIDYDATSGKKFAAFPYAVFVEAVGPDGTRVAGANEPIGKPSAEFPMEKAQNRGDGAVLRFKLRSSSPPGEYTIRAGKYVKAPPDKMVDAVPEVMFEMKLHLSGE
jgi:ankyrin repeat protein